MIRNYISSWNVSDYIICWFKVELIMSKRTVQDVTILGESPITQCSFVKSSSVRSNTLLPGNFFLLTEV